MPELIDEGITGTTVADITSAAAAVGAVADLDRSVIRARAVERFGVDRMADDYVHVYEKAIAGAAT